MKVRWALLTIAVALVLGIGAGFAFGHVARPMMQMALSCILLDEAEKAGYLDKQKRGVLIDQAAKAKSLDSSARQSVLNLKGGCLT